MIQSNPHGDFTESEWVFEKFAELIVRECAGLFNSKDTDSCYPPASVREIIEEHFGVNA